MASFDPPATLVELASLIGYLAVAYTCVRLTSIRRARHGLAVIVDGVATLAALVTLIHHAFGLTALYGVYTPSFMPHIVGPLLGVNHLASLLSLAVPIGLAIAVSSAGLVWLGWLTAAATLAATTLLTGSRGDTVGLLAGPEDDAMKRAFALVRERLAERIGARVAGLFSLAEAASRGDTTARGERATTETDVRPDLVPTDPAVVANAVQSALDDELTEVLRLLAPIAAGGGGDPAGSVPVSLRGDLRVVPIAEILQLLDAQKQTGLFEVEHGGAGSRSPSAAAASIYPWRATWPTSSCSAASSSRAI